MSGRTRIWQSPVLALAGTYQMSARTRTPGFDLYTRSLVARYIRTGNACRAIKNIHDVFQFDDSDRTAIGNACKAGLCDHACFTVNCACQFAGAKNAGALTALHLQIHDAPRARLE